MHLVYEDAWVNVKRNNALREMAIELFHASAHCRRLMYGLAAATGDFLVRVVVSRAQLRRLLDPETGVIRKSGIVGHDFQVSRDDKERRVGIVKKYVPPVKLIRTAREKTEVEKRRNGGLVDIEEDTRLWPEATIISRKNWK